MTADEAREALQRCRAHLGDAVRAVSVPAPDRAACATACARCVSELCELMEAMAWGGVDACGEARQ